MKRWVRRWIMAAGIAVSLAFTALALAYFGSFIARSNSSEAFSPRVTSRDARLPVTLTVFGRGSDTISARLSFFTPEGEIAGTIERSWAGWELKLDCVMIGSPSGWLVFPFRLSTDMTAKGGGVSLLRYYTHSRFPSIYDSPLLSADEREALTQLFSIVRTERWMPPFLGSLHHEVVTIRSFQANTEYFLYVSGDGTLSLREN